MADLFAIVLAASLRSIFLLGVVGALARAWRRGPASGRHVLWLVALGGMLVIPLVEHMAPAWRIRIDAAPAAVRAGMRRAFDDDVRVNAPVAVAPVRLPSVTRSSAPSWTAASVLAVASWLWIAGGLMFVARLFIGWISTHRLRRRSHVVPHARILAIAHEASRRLGISAVPPVLLSTETAVPVVCGWFRSAVLLPASAGSWPEHEIRAALLHELAHVRRRDGAGQLLAALVCCIYWFHPGAWMASRALATERELACDELVLGAGIDPIAYADQLLSLARRMSVSAYASMAMAMARPGTLEPRLQRILRWTPRAPSWHRRRRLAAAPAVLGFVGALGALQVVPPTRPHAISVTPAEEQPREQQGLPARRTLDDAVRRPITARHTFVRASATSIRPSATAASTTVARMILPVRQGVCGAGIPNEITVSDAMVGTQGTDACRRGPALVQLHFRDGALHDVDVTVGGSDTTDGTAVAPAAMSALLLDAVPTLDAAAAARAIQAAAVIDGPDIAERLVAFARAPAGSPIAQRMSVVWAAVVGGQSVQAALLTILRDESIDPTVREQVVITLGARALPTALDLARRSPSARMRHLAAHRIGLALPVEDLLEIYPSLPDAEARGDFVDRVAERGSLTQREQLAQLLARDEGDAVRTRGLDRLRRS